MKWINHKQNHKNKQLFLTIFHLKILNLKCLFCLFTNRHTFSAGCLTILRFVNKQKRPFVRFRTFSINFYLGEKIQCIFLGFFSKKVETVIQICSNSGPLKFFGPIWGFVLKQSPEFMIPAFQDSHLEPNITKCGDSL